MVKKKNIYYVQIHIYILGLSTPTLNKGMFTPLHIHLWRELERYKEKRELKMHD